MRRIRNEVAHNTNPISFDTQEIKSRCLELAFAGDVDYDTVRNRFLANCQELIAALHLLVADWLLKEGKTKIRIRRSKALRHFLAELKH